MLVKAYSIEEALANAEKYYNCPRSCLKVYTIKATGGHFLGNYQVERNLQDRGSQKKRRGG
ncbi:hypothetical protein [Caldicoprobacter algeriensis]|uniref:hypothetical protein n=1 Tax=Caldicoprobacter algeriensis TaxID=699281 RepID=UPI00207AF9EA|nr:hypothetical protein [Caldicoprobacter algeriensis]